MDSLYNVYYIFYYIIDIFLVNVCRTLDVTGCWRLTDEGFISLLQVNTRRTCLMSHLCSDGQV